ncbi:MAG TPA: N-methyl-L-tryptophan oxidase [Kouleothrix sp.]|uniref:N-methyl-L-tryptophan oxidase n=1 Tax=Kouleothrix sp. TaxID=2779161 RepID=UPI002B764850|nr:N-methyl-L-tryptophan oxidase [Kouleothrix sp.]
MTETFDTIVLGLGAMGSAAAYQLALRGQRVLGLERFRPGHDQGSSHGQSRIIRQAYYEDPAYVPLLLRAYELWDQIQRESGDTLLTITGGLMIGEAESAVVTGSIRSAREHNLQYDLLDAAEIRRRWPGLTPSDNIVALYERLGGVLYPEAAIAAHLARAEARGAELHYEEPATEWQASASGDRVRVTTARGSYEAGRLIISAGAWAPELLHGLGLPLTVKRNVLYWFDPVGGREPFLADRCPIYIWEAEDGSSFYGFPALSGTPAGVKVAFHNFGPLCTPTTVDRVVHPEEVAHMREWLRQRMPALSAGELLDARTCLYTLTPDMDFLVGPHPQHPQVTIASPCSGHGFKFASVMGEILADLAVDGATRHPIALFDPMRFQH